MGAKCKRRIKQGKLELRIAGEPRFPMQATLRRRLRIMCGVGILILLCLLLLAASQEICWVGSTDLTVEFVVTYAETGEPVRDVDISILSFGGLNGDGHRMSDAGV